MTENTEEPDFLELGRRLFSGEAAFFWASSKVDQLPPMQMLEIAFAGRSNVGKSSLVNALTGRKTLARTSHTPGRTQELNFFNIGDRFALVDMPGYGFAAVSKVKVEAWNVAIRAYLRGRSSLARVFLLIDSRHGARESDLEVMDLLDQSAVSYQLVLTKADDLTEEGAMASVAAAKAAIKKRAAAFPEVALTSSRTGRGIAELRANIAQLVNEHRG